MILKYILTLLLILTSLNALQINKDLTSQSILEHSQFYIDKSSTLNIHNIINKKFKKTDTNYIRLGYVNSKLWIKFSIKNNANKLRVIHLALTNPIIDTVILFTKTNDSYKKEMQGQNHLSNYLDEDILHPTFQIELKANEEKEFYLQTHSISSANYYQLYIKDIKESIKNEYLYQIIESLFFGAMIALLIYNIFIYIFTKEKAYLFYILYILFVTINHLSYTSMINILLGKEYSYLDSFLNLYYINISTIFGLLFIKEFLNLHKNRIFNKISNILVLILSIIMIVNTKEYYLMNIDSILITICVFFILYVSIYSYIKKVEEAKYILIGWIINIIGIIAISLNQEGITNPIDIWPYFYEFTTFVEVILFSIALAAKLNKTRELENSLKTNKFLLKELHHRVKNNMQFIILLYRLKLSKLITPQIDEKLYETESSILAMSKIHEILHTKKLERISTEEHFEKLISKIRSSYIDLDVKIKLNINTNLQGEQTIYLGIILNELITNSFKYAFKEKKGEINISLIKENNKNLVRIYDNGIGFDYNWQNVNSFGLLFVEAMVKDELAGKIDFINDNGTKIDIVF